jgi:UDP-N-acetylmuramyl pentapeptide synthase
LIGLHNLTNILLAIGVGIIVNVSPDKMSVGIKKVNGISARLEKKTHKNGAVVINNGYNSNLDSVEQTLSVLKMFPVRNKVVVTPGIVECSDNYIDNKSFARIISKFATKVIIVGDYNLKALKDGLVEGGFNENNIIIKRTIFNVYDYIENADENWVFLIENDLPENYR